MPQGNPDGIGAGVRRVRSKRSAEMKDYVLCLIVVALGMQVVVAGCSHIVPAVDAARQYQQWREEKKAAERAEAERIEQERAEKEAAEQAEKERREREAYEAALAPPHPPQKRTEAYDAWNAYVEAGEKPTVTTVDNPGWGGTLWKTPNHGLDGSVLLLDAAWMKHYKANEIRSVVIAADPWGREIIKNGEGRIEKPYHERPAVRFDRLGQAYRPGPVFIVLHFKDCYRAGVWALSDPGMRTER
jgi:hypothetical protein